MLLMPVGADQNTGTPYLSVITSQKKSVEKNKGHFNAQSVTLSPQPSLPRHLPNPLSLVCLIDTLRKPVL